MCQLEHILYATRVVDIEMWDRKVEDFLILGGGKLQFAAKLDCEWAQLGFNSILRIIPLHSFLLEGTIY